MMVYGIVPVVAEFGARRLFAAIRSFNSASSAAIR
jgi:hypothetical protein